MTIPSWAAPRPVLAVPTAEHYLPLLYLLGAQDKADNVGFFADKVTLGSMFDAIGEAGLIPERGTACFRRPAN